MAKLLAGASATLREVALGTSVSRHDLEGELFVQSPGQLVWVVRGGFADADVVDGPVVGWAPEVIDRLVDGVGDVVVDDVRRTRPPGWRRVLRDRLQDVAPRVAEAMGALERRWLDGERTSWVPAIRAFDLPEGRLVGHRVRAVIGMLEPVGFSREDDRLVEQILHALGVAEVGYHLVPQRAMLRASERVDADALWSDLVHRALRPEGSVEDVLRRLTTEVSSGAEDASAWQAWWDGLPRAERATLGDAVAVAWGTGAWWPELQRRSHEALRHAWCVAGLWSFPDPVGVAALERWEYHHDVQLPEDVRWFLTRISRVTGLRVETSDVVVRGLALPAAPFRTPSGLVIVNEARTADEQLVWAVAPDGQLVVAHGDNPPTPARPGDWMARVIYTELLDDRLPVAPVDAPR